jgi:hypothetical protein
MLAARSDDVFKSGVAPKNLRRLSERPEEGAPHPFPIAEARLLCDDID